MMDENRLRGLMGLCARARQGVFGEDACLKSVRSGECAVLLLDAGASKATTEKYTGSCESAGVPLVILREDLLWEATGRPGKAMAIKKGGLADQIRRLCEEK